MTGSKTETEKTNILIVDDRKENLLALEGWLEDFNLDIAKASSGEEALAQTLKNDFALVLMDVQMPGMDGFETARLMRGTEKTKKVPIIFVTAISKEDEHIFKGYEAGAVDYIFKPLNPYVLRSKVTVFVRLHRQNKQLEKTIADLRRANETIKKLSIRDSLTGCYNRRYFNEHLPKEIKRAFRYNSILSLIMTDIDHFKHVNDTYGHQCGDEVLRTFSDILNSRIRKDVDWISRYGGEEFVLVLPETKLKDAAKVAEELRENVAETVLSCNNGRRISISASFGVSDMDSFEGTPRDVATQIVNQADKRLYHAKNQGRNKVVAEEKE